MAESMSGKGAMTRAAKSLAVVGGTAIVTKIASDALVERLFVLEEGATPRTADEEKQTEAYRGGVQIVGGALLGKLLWKSYRQVAMGVALGGVVGGGLRIATAYEWDTSIRDLLDGEDTAETPARGVYGRRAPRALGSGGDRQYTGPIVTRERVPLR